ncbi:MAG TPA: hypothetical protein VGC87_09725 [Pyrinomonadaceae bacterium]
MIVKAGRKRLKPGLPKMTTEVIFMNWQDYRLQCEKCSHAPFLQPIRYDADGSLLMICTCCQADGGVLHLCPHNHPAAQPSWLPLLLAGIEIVCPKCKAAYDLGMKIEQVNPEAGELVKVVAVAAGSYILLNVLAEIFGGKKRRS